MPCGPGLVEDAGRSANQPASPESGALGVGSRRQSVLLAPTFLRRLTQSRKLICHSSVLQAPSGANEGTPAVGTGAADAGTTDQDRVATAATRMVRTSALARRAMSCLQVG
jgi:hypothetical protein